MCGLFGLVDSSNALDVQKARASLNLQSHRGPDGFGEWIEDGCYMGHRRLSILDLSDAGKQPMSARSCVVSVNGEIYNYKDLKAELSRFVAFKSESDSEVILHGYQHWGLEGLLRRIEGMYALVIYDLERAQLHLVRDHIGIKPLYYAKTPTGLIWSSELKSIQRYLSLGESDYCAESLLDFATYRYIPSPKTLYRQVSKLAAGRFLSYSLSTQTVHHSRYWSVPAGVTLPSEPERLLDVFEEAISASLDQQMVSDVPVGSFLSGGIDSGLLVAVSKKLKVPSIPTFSIGFDDSKYDETSRIKEVAEHLHVNNYLETMCAQSSSLLWPSMAEWFDEPFADFSALPTYLVCRASRKSVTVALSGDGADELFGGYERYLHADKIISSTRCLSPLLGKLKQSLGWSVIGRLVRQYEYQSRLSGWDWYCITMGGLLPNETARMAELLSISKDYDPYWLYRKHWDSSMPSSLALRKLEMETSLPEALLTKVDRVSMQCSLEVRVPYLSTRLVDLSMGLQEQHLFGQGQTKWLLRQLAKRHLPDQISSAGKKGFGVPPTLRLSEMGRRCSVQHKVLIEQMKLNKLNLVIK